MMIYIVGKDDKELFSKIGKLALDPATHRKMGYHVATKNGDIWSVTNNHKSFMVATPRLNGLIKVRLVFIDNKMSFIALIEQIERYAIDKKFTGIKANDLRKHAESWLERGYKLVTTVGTRFANYEKEFPSDK